MRVVEGKISHLLRKTAMQHLYVVVIKGMFPLQELSLGTKNQDLNEDIKGGTIFMGLLNFIYYLNLEQLGNNVVSRKQKSPWNL